MSAHVLNNLRERSYPPFGGRKRTLLLRKAQDDSGILPVCDSQDDSVRWVVCKQPCGYAAGVNEGSGRM